MFISLAAFSAPADNRELVEQRVKELVEMNKVALEKIKDIDKLNNKTVYLKATVRQNPDSSYSLSIDEVLADGQKIEDVDKNPSTIFIKGKISKSQGDSKYKLDIESVMPPPAEKKPAPSAKEDKDKK